MRVDPYLAAVLKLAALMRLTTGIYAIQAPGVPLSVEQAARYAMAATYYAHAPGVDPYELIGLARNESDFIERERGPDGKDCGLTQTRITVSRYSCLQLRRSYALAFAEATRELHEYARACRGHADYDRCRLNHYNSGVRYARHGFHGAYRLRVGCFAEAARRAIDVGQGCRHVRGRHDIGRALHRGVPRARDVVATDTTRPGS